MTSRSRSSPARSATPPITTRCSRAATAGATLYDPAVGFLRGKNADGTFPSTAFDPTRA